MKSSMFATAALLAVSTLTFVSSANAAVVSGSFAEGEVTNANLDAVGSLDWVIWEYDGTDAPVSPSVQNERAGGTAIGALDVNFNGVATLSKFDPNHTYDYTTGTSPASATGDGPYGANVKANLANLVGTSATFSVTVDSVLEHTFTLYGAHRRTGSQVNVFLNGDATALDTASLANGGDAGTNYQWVYTATFTPDNIGDVFEFQLTTDGASSQPADGSNNYRFSAAAVSVIPEPASLALLGLGGLLIAGRRRQA